MAQLGISKLKSNCPVSKRACVDHDASLWWALVVGNLPTPVQEWIEEQEFTECDDLREAATVQVRPIRVEAAVVFARGSTFKEGTGHFLSLVQMHKLISLKNFGQERPLETTVSSPETPVQGGTQTTDISVFQKAMPSPTQVRKDHKDAFEQMSLDPEDQNRLYLQIPYRFKRTKELEERAGLYIPDDEFPSDVFWGRLEKQYRDKGYFENIEWGKVEPRTKNKLNIQKASKGLSFTAQGSPNFQ